jgi:signal transduction histidine kinase
MPLAERRVLEHNRNQGNGEPSAPPIGVELQPAIHADLLDPALWQDGLATYARGTSLAVALADAAGRLLGSTINPRPTWSLLHAKAPPVSPPASEGAAGGAGCPFSLVPPSPCNCVADALARGGFVMARDRTGLVHFAVPLVLGEHPLGALVAGQVFDQYPDQLALEHVARQLGLSPAPAWQAARLEHPIKRATLEVYADLLATLGQTFLQTRYHTILAAVRRGQERLAEANEGRARLLKQVLSAREEEQRRISRDLHDGIGQSLTSLLLGLRFAEEMPTFEEARARLGELRCITAALLDEVRRLARGLRPTVLDDLGLAAFLERYAADYTRAHGIAVDVYAPDLALARLPAEVETALYRIAQETLTNVLKHAAAKSVSLVVRRESSGVHLTVEDDGLGFDNDALLQSPGAGEGLGLLDIRERVALLNGSVTLESRPGRGTTVHVCIPLREKNHGEDSRRDR